MNLKFVLQLAIQCIFLKMAKLFPRTKYCLTKQKNNDQKHYIVNLHNIKKKLTAPIPSVKNLYVNKGK